MSEVPPGTPVAVAWAETDLGPAATARIQNREVFQADLSIQGPIPSFHKNAKVWFDYFDDDKDGKLSKPQLIQALVDTYSTVTGNPPDIGRVMETVDDLFSIAGLEDGQDVSIYHEIFLCYLFSLSI